jgi:hypothetical protein
MLDQSPGQLAEDCRREAALATDRLARDGWLKRAAEYEAEASASGLLADALFREASVETFREGYVFRPGANAKGVQQDRSDWGYWACDIAHQDRLSWSDKVYELFGLPAGVPVDREWAVGRYAAHSRATLQRVREYALRHAFGFMLDAEIELEEARRRWIRVLAVPVSENGRIARLHGLKRAL